MEEMLALVRKILRGIAIFVGGLVVLIVLLYLEEDWRGARDWADCRRELEAKGEILDLRKLAPPGDPKDDLSKVPIFAEVYAEPLPQYTGLISQDSGKPVRVDRIDLRLGSRRDVDIPQNGNFRKSKAIDLFAWQHFYRSLPEAHLPKEPGTAAQDVLTALSQFEPEMKEVEAALDNQKAYWPINYDRPFDTIWGGVTHMVSIAKVLPLRAVAHFENKETYQAKNDYLLSFETGQTVEQSTFLVDFLVAIGVRALDDSILWEGIRRHAWDGAQLQEIDSALSSVDFMSLGQRAFRFERAFTLRSMEVLQKERSAWREISPSYGSGGLTVFYIRPSGWWDQDCKKLCLMLQEQIDSIDPVEGILKRVPERETVGIRFFQFIYTPANNVSYVGEFGPIIAESETNRRLARVACRLEEFYLVHKEYPQMLDNLGPLPVHLNQEVLSGKPLHYRRKGSSYLLYSTGWDGKDHGGTPRQQGSNGLDYDWVWPGP